MCTLTGKNTENRTPHENAWTNHLKAAGLRRIFFRCALITFFFSLRALSQHQPLMFEHLTVDDGLSQNSVNAILEDHKGFLWFGTADGLNRYDGYQFKTYKSYSRDSLTLSSNTVRTLYEDRTGTLWIGTGEGLNSFNRKEGVFQRFSQDGNIPEVIRSGSVELLRGDSRGELWIVTAGVLICYDSSRSRFHSYADAGPAASHRKAEVFTNIIEDNKGILWVGTNEGLKRCNRSTNELEHINGPWDAPLKRGSVKVFPVFADKDSSLWLCVEKIGIVCFNSLTGASSAISYNEGNAPGLAGRAIVTAVGDSSGRIWIGTADSGLYIYDPHTRLFTHYAEDARNPLSLNFNIIHAIVIDRAGTFWIGTDGAGVNIMNPHKNHFAHTKHIVNKANGLAGNFLKALYEDPTGTLWVGTMGRGLSRRNPNSGKWKTYSHDRRNKSSIASDVVLAVCEDRSGFLWIGTDSCLMKFNRKTEKFARIPLTAGDIAPVFQNHINTIFNDREGMLWLGTQAHLRILDPKTGAVAPVNDQSEKPGNVCAWNATSICEDSKSDVWIATLGYGVCKFDRAKKLFTRYTKSATNANSLSNDFVRSVYSDPSDILWFGTEEGLNRFDPATESFTVFTERDGLASNFIYGILADSRNNLWISTNNGISKFTEQNQRGSQFRNYGVADGLQAKEFNTGAYWKNMHGEMYFGGINGFNTFHPDSVWVNLRPPPVVITQLNVYDRIVAAEGAIDEKNEMQLSYHDNEIRIDFVALDYTQPGENKYAYKLVGLDHEWVEAGTQRFARYTNLEPGNYTFFVKASNNDGVWNDRGTSLKITIVPPFWMTSWFLSLAFIAAVSAVGGGVRYFELRKIKRRMQALEAERTLDRERSRISQDMHDEVGSTLTRIAILGELAQRNIGRHEETQVQLQKISEMSRDVIDNLGEIVWALNPKNDTLDNLLAYTRQYVAEYIEVTPIHCTLDFPETVPSIALSAETRRNIFLTVKEAVHNIVKHAKAEDVRVQCAVTGTRLRITIKDNGKGFSLGAEVRAGNGLTNMKKRIDDINGVLTVDSLPAAGTTVGFEVELASNEQLRDPLNR